MNYNQDQKGLSFLKALSIALCVVAVLVLIVFSGKIWQNVNADQIVVTQDPIDGDLHWHITAGLKFQKWGRVTEYIKSSQYWFSKQEDQGDDVDQSIRIRFNDGGHARISGSYRWELPLGDSILTMLHSKFGSMRAVEQELIRPVLEKSVYMTGPLMSSKQSYAETRNDLILFIEDQAKYGIYRTESNEITGKDQMTGAEKTITVVERIKDSNAPGGFARQEESPFQTFGIKTYNLSLNAIDYDSTVERQIESQQSAIMEVQTAIAEAKKAEQKAITAEKNGQAEAAKAKWLQEVEKAKFVTLAEQQRDVARLEKEAATFTKQKDILLGQGEAERKRLVMKADGALKQKLATWLESQKAWAAAVGAYQGDWVPKTQFNGTGAKGGVSQPQLFMDIFNARNAQALSLDMSVPKGK
jgi:hypothetical protein